MLPQPTNLMVLAKLKSMHLVLNMLIFTRTLVTYARTTFKPHCCLQCLNVQSMRTQAESTDIAHNMFGQIKMRILWYNSRQTLISRKRDGKPRMVNGQFVVVRVGVHQLSVSPNTSHPMLRIRSKLLHPKMGIVRPVWTACTYNSHPRRPWKALSNWAVQQALEWGYKLRSAWTTLCKVTLLILSILLPLKSLTADRNQWNCNGSCPHSQSAAQLIVDRFTPNVPFKKCKWSEDSKLLACLWKTSTPYLTTIHTSRILASHKDVCGLSAKACSCTNLRIL